MNRSTLVIALGLLAVCSTNTPKIEHDIRDTKGKAEVLHDEMEANGLSLNEGSFELKIDNGIWVSTGFVKSDTLLPAVMTKSTYSLNKPDGMTLGELSSFITRKTGIKTIRSSELVNSADQGNNSPGTKSSLLPLSMEAQSGDAKPSRTITLKKYKPSLKNVTLQELLDHTGEKARIRTFLLQDIRDMLGVEDGRYPKIAEFRRHVLDKAKAELKNKTDLFFEYNPLNKGRNIYAFRFLIKVNEDFEGSKNIKIEIDTDEIQRKIEDSSIIEGAYSGST